MTVVKAQILLEALQKALSAEEMQQIIQDAYRNEDSIAELINMPEALIEKMSQEGTDHYKNHAFDKALPYFQFLATAQSNAQPHWMKLGAIWMQLNSFEEALKAYAVASIIEPEDPLPYFFSAFCYSKLEKQTDMKLSLQQVLVLCDNKPYYNELKTEASFFLQSL